MSICFRHEGTSRGSSGSREYRESGSNNKTSSSSGVKFLDPKAEPFKSAALFIDC